MATLERAANNFSILLIATLILTSCRDFHDKPSDGGDPGTLPVRLDSGHDFFDAGNTGSGGDTMVSGSGGTGGRTGLSDGGPGDAISTSAETGGATVVDSGTLPKGSGGAGGVANGTNSDAGSSSSTGGMGGGSPIPPAAVVFDADAFDFGTVDVGSAPSHIFTVTNRGTQSAGPLAAPILGGDPSFSVAASDCAGAALAGSGVGHCTVTIRYQPPAYGARAASLTIAASPGGSASASLTGIGRQTLTLQVSKATSSGTGTVTSTAPSGDIVCGATCSHDYVVTTRAPTVTLAALPGDCSTFAGWSGVAGCTSPTSPCLVTVDVSKVVTARFDPASIPITVTRALVDGAQGSVSAVGGTQPAVCGPTCSFNVNCGTTVTLTASSGGSKSGFAGWSGAGGTCSGATSPCAFNVTSPTSVTGTFTPYNLAFVTSKTSTPNLGGIAGANATCRTLASAAALPAATSYVAFLSTDAVDAITQLGSARGWIRPDGLPFADTSANLANRVVWYPLDLTESGTQVLDSTFVFTGTRSDGTRAPGYNCNAWTSAAGTFNVEAGSAIGGAGNWVYWAFAPCNNIDVMAGRLYCFGTRYTVPVTPPSFSGPRRRVFVSSTLFSPGPSMTIGNADGVCKADAVTAGLCTSASSCAFKAVLAQTSQSAKAHFTNQDGPTPVVRADNVKVADSSTGFWLGTFTAAVSELADGSYSSAGDRYYTGAASPIVPGTAASTCNNWSSATAATGAIYGVPMMGPEWFNWTNVFGCTGGLNLYCLEDVP